MKNKRNKAWRRFQAEKSKKRAYNVFKFVRQDKECGLSEEEIIKKVAFRHNHMVDCSNPMCCGNPRKTIGRNIYNIQEIKNNESYSLFLKELNNN